MSELTRAPAHVYVDDMHRRGSLLRCDNSQIDLDGNGVHS